GATRGRDGQAGRHEARAGAGGRPARAAPGPLLHRSAAVCRPRLARLCRGRAAGRRGRARGGLHRGGAAAVPHARLHPRDLPPAGHEDLPACLACGVRRAAADPLPALPAHPPGPSQQADLRHAGGRRVRPVPWPCRGGERQALRAEPRAAAGAVGALCHPDAAVDGAAADPREDDSGVRAHGAAHALPRAGDQGERPRRGHGRGVVVLRFRLGDGRRGRPGRLAVGGGLGAARDRDRDAQHHPRPRRHASVCRGGPGARRPRPVAGFAERRLQQPAHRAAVPRGPALSCAAPRGALPAVSRAAHRPPPPDGTAARGLGVPPGDRALARRRHRPPASGHGAQGGGRKGVTTAISRSTQAVVLSSSAPSSTGLTYSWDFGDGSTSTDASPQHSYAKPGDYTVRLTVGNGSATVSGTASVSVNDSARLRANLCTKADGAGWCLLRGTQSAVDLADVSWSSATRGLAVTLGGVVLDTQDGGQTWSPFSLGLALDGEEPQRLVASDASTVQAGMTLVQPAAAGAYYADVAALDDNRAWVVRFDPGTASSTVLATTNAGEGWSPAGVAANLQAQAVRVWDAQRLALLGRVPGTDPSGSCVSTSSDGGQTWARSCFAEEAADLVWRDAQTLWLVGQPLRRSTDAGRTWSVVDIGLGAQDRPVTAQFPTTNFGVMVGGNGLVLVTRDGGGTWQRQARATGQRLDGISFTDSKNGWITGIGVVLGTGTGGD
ncbi:PKD domain protein, partial [Ostertagia ostertagi]